MSDSPRLRLTEASKVREWPEQKNGFALPAIREICTHATPTCWKGCYAKKGRLAFGNCKRKYLKNYQALLKAGTARGMANLILEELRKVRFSIFRIHVSGEFFSATYAAAWARVCHEYPDANFWCYTHSQEPDVIRILNLIPNLKAFLSCDRDNWQQMLKLSKRFPRMGLSYYSVGEKPPNEVYERGGSVPVDMPTGLVVFPDKRVQKKSHFWLTCPTERADAVMKKNEACIRCRRCWIRQKGQRAKVT